MNPAEVRAKIGNPKSKPIRRKGGLASAFSENTNKTRILWALIACFALPLIIYSNTLHAPFIFDDESKIMSNPDIKSLDGIWGRLIQPFRGEGDKFRHNDPSRPLTYLTFALNYHFGKLNTFGYHLVNVLLHALIAVLVFFISRKIIFHAYKLRCVFMPLSIALIFASHPVNSYVVAYIFSRSDCLATLFYLLSILLFINTFEGKKYCYPLSLLSFVLAIYSKQIAITLPAVLLMYDWIFLSNYGFRKVKERAFFHAAYWGLSFGYMAYRYFYLGGLGDIEARVAFGRYSYFISQPYVVLKYFQMLVFPSGLCLDHALIPAESIFQIKILASFAVVAALFLFTIYLAIKKYPWKVLPYSILWFLVTLSPTSSIFPTTRVLVENRMYLPGIGILLLIVFLYAKIFGITSENPSVPKTQNVFTAVLCVHIGLFSVLSWQRIQPFNDPILLWENVASIYPNHDGAHNTLGLLYVEKKQYDKAIKHYQAAIALNPNNDRSLNNLGTLYFRMGDNDNALKYHTKAIGINPRNPNAYNNLGNVFYRKKDFEKSLDYYVKAIEIDPYNSEACNNAGSVYYEINNYAKAIQYYQKAFELNPDKINYRFNMGLAYYKLGEYDKAIVNLQDVIMTTPNDGEAHQNLGMIFFDLKEYDRAVNELENALRMLPGNVTIQKQLDLSRHLSSPNK